MDKRHTDFLIKISCNEKSVNLWKGAFLPRGGLFSLGKNAREAFLPGGHFRLLHRSMQNAYGIPDLKAAMQSDRTIHFG